MGFDTINLRKAKVFKYACMTTKAGQKQLTWPTFSRHKEHIIIWLTDGSCIRLRPERKNHVWSYDFVEDRTLDGRKLRFLNIIDESTRECLASIPRRSWRGNDIMLCKGVPEYLRSDNGSEFIAQKLRQWLSDIGVITTYIEPGSPLLREL